MCVCARVHGAFQEKSRVISLISGRALGPLAGRALGEDRHRPRHCDVVYQSVGAPVSVCHGGLGLAVALRLPQLFLREDGRDPPQCWKSFGRCEALLRGRLPHALCLRPQQRAKQRHIRV